MNTLTSTFQAPDPAVLTRVLPGLDFNAPERRDFLFGTENRDVQAAPGSGKTTLLVAKLCLLAESWSESRRGVCVLSHTNVARSEVQTRLATQPRGQALLGYPHFIGTSTAFIHQFLAMPHLRGLGVDLTVVEDEAFAAEALREMEANHSIRAWMTANKANAVSAQKLAQKLFLDPRTMQLADHDRLPRPGKVRSGLEAIRDRLTKRGMFLYSDMLAVAQLVLERRSALADRLSERFPIVLIDEAQDTPSHHKALLQTIFPHIRWIGDCNQNIYRDGQEEGGWMPRDGYIDLGGSKRFGPKTAAFASRLTLAKAQEIGGEDGQDRIHSLILFDRDAIKQVLPTYCRLLTQIEGLPQELDAWAVAARHKHPDTQRQTWPNCIGDYWESYSHPGQQASRASTLIGILCEARHKFHGMKSPQAAMTSLGFGLFRFLRKVGWNVEGMNFSQARLWHAIEERCPGTRLKMRKLLRDAIILPWPTNEVEWKPYVGSVMEMVEALVGRPLAADDPFFTFNAEPVLSSPSGTENSFLWDQGGRQVRVRLGTIASVKGQTHDTTLVMETNEGSKMDVAEALKTAFLDSPAPLGKFATKALTNVFVGSTRPRYGLCLATRREAVDPDLERTIRNAQWSVIDLTAR